MLSLENVHLYADRSRECCSHDKVLATGRSLWSLFACLGLGRFSGQTYGDGSRVSREADRPRPEISVLLIIGSVRVGGTEIKLKGSQDSLNCKL